MSVGGLALKIAWNQNLCAGKTSKSHNIIFRKKNNVEGFTKSFNRR